MLIRIVYLMTEKLTSNGYDNETMASAVPTFWIPASMATVLLAGYGSPNIDAQTKPSPIPRTGRRTSATYMLNGTSLKISGKIMTSKVSQTMIIRNPATDPI